MNTRLIAAAAGVACVAGVSSAGLTVMDTAVFGPNTPDYTQQVTLDKFDSDLGVLQSIKVKLFMEISGGNASVDNDSDNPAVVDVEFGAVGSISSVDVTLLDGGFNPVAADVNLVAMQQFMLAGNDGDPQGTFELGGPDSATLDGAGLNDMSMGFINALFFNEYQASGGGTFTVDIDVDTAFSVSGGSGVAGAFNPVTAQGNVMVIYEYIPTPSTAAMLALGGLVATRRRR